MWVDFDVRGQQGFLTGESVMDYGLIFDQKWQFKVKTSIDEQVIVMLHFSKSVLIWRKTHWHLDYIFYKFSFLGELFL